MILCARVCVCACAHVVCVCTAACPCILMHTARALFNKLPHAVFLFNPFARWFQVKRVSENLLGCQVQKVLGLYSHRHAYKCGGPVKTFREDLMQEAIRRVENMAFVGITEHYLLSICLFHAITGTPMEVAEVSVHMRMGNRNVSKAKENAALRLFDKYDNALYQAGVARMKRDVRTYLPQIREICPSALEEALEFIGFKSVGGEY